MTSLEQWKQIQQKIDNLAIRDRVFVGIVILAVIYLIWEGIIIGDTFSGADSGKKIEIANTNIASMEDKINKMNEIIGKNTLEEIKKKNVILRKENKILHEKIVSIAGELVGPKEMVNILKDLVEQIEGLTVSRLESVAVTPMFHVKKTEEEPTTRQVQVYIHGLIIELTGNYFSTLKFLDSVEQHNLQIWWDEVEYTVDGYPNAKIKILLHTLSLEEGFIGV